MTKLRHQLVHHFLEESARDYPDSCALVHAGAQASYRELNLEANRFAHWLIGEQAAPGERVVLLLENCREYLASYYGALKAGAVAIPLNPDLKKEQLEALFQEIEPHFLVCSSRCEKTLKELAPLPPSLRRVVLVRPRLSWEGAALSFQEATGSGGSENPAAALKETDLASIIFTSGSTGKPKGVMLGHRNIVANTHSIVEYLELTHADIQMVVLPFFYVMGKSLLNTHIAVGGRVVINNTFAYPASVIQQMVQEEVTGFSGVPSTFAYLLHRSPLRAFRDQLPALRYCSQAGGHLARQTKEELLRVLPDHTRMYVMYGATEASARLAYVEPERLREKIDSIGIPIPGVTMKVLGENGIELPAGETGELVASGANIMLGYWRDPEATAKALSEHGYRTGDQGYRDEAGYFFVVGRKDSQLKVAGHRVAPQEIEDALIATGLVLEAAVVGVEDPLAGTRLVAVAVVIEETTTVQEILLHCSRLLPRHKIPSELRLVRALPKNSSGKIDKESCAGLFQTATSGSHTLQDG